MTEQKKAGLARITGTAETAKMAQDMINAARDQAHLIAPATACDALPEGVGISFSRVDVDIRQDDKGRFLSKDTYEVNGERGLSKCVLDKIAAACGISWDPIASQRLDDGSDPHYCRYRAVATYIAFDGKPQTLSKEREIDMRENSGVVTGLMERYTEKRQSWIAGGRRGYEPKDPRAQIREVRIHIQSHAESKAQNRVVRQLGVKTSYPLADLKKPFIMARACWTGRTNDPDLKLPFAMMTGQAFLGGVRSLYGNTPQQPSHAPRLSPPPPIGSTDDSGEHYLDMQEDEPEEPATDSDGGGNREPPKGEPERKRSGFTMPFGRDKGKAIEDSTTENLEWMARNLAEKIESGEARYPEKDQKFVDAIHSEIAYREGL